MFKDDDGTVLDSSQTCYGHERPDFKGTTKATMSDDYELVGWIREGDPIPENDWWWFKDWTPVIERTIYVAVYRYKVKFVNDDLSELYYDYFLRGSVPSLSSYVTPFKAPTVETYYEFVGWDKEFTPATEPTTYTAIYTPVPVPPSPVLQIADGETFVIDDFEDGDETSSLGTDWFVYNDNDVCWYYSGNVCERYYQSTISKQVTDEGAPSMFCGLRTIVTVADGLALACLLTLAERWTCRIAVLFSTITRAEPTPLGWKAHTG